MTGNDDVAARTAADQTAAHEAAEVADQQGLLFDDDVSPLPSERATEDDSSTANDELSARRRARAAG